ncbi:hypothetical protein F5Y08DRAFT_338053 [Xylaria arbuscula]|nr:hypothetical protein F5Y08DRAFT_338053 [Xylaria arbuscula]
METTLETIPVDVMGCITTFLDARSILQIRLVSRQLVDKVPRYVLSQIFSEKTIQLNREDLEKFIYITSQGRAGCLLQRCTLIGLDFCGIDYETDPEYPVLIRLLTEAFVNIKEHSPSSSLLSLNLGVRNLYRVGKRLDYYPIPESTPKHSGNTAKWVLHAARTALQGSHLSVDHHLELFTSIEDEPISRLHYATILSAGDCTASTAMFSSLKKLSFCVSSKYEYNWAAGNATIRGEDVTIQKEHATMLLKRLPLLLASMPKLEDLDVHWYNIGSPPVEDHPPDIDPSTRLVFPRLKRCSLEGLYVSADDLLAFLKNLETTELVLTFINLVQGTWVPIFDYLLSSSSTIASYSLDDLMENGRLVHFNIPGRSKFLYRNIVLGPNTFHRRPHEVERPINYSIGPSAKRPQDYHPSLRHFYSSKRIRYGALAARD